MLGYDPEGCYKWAMFISKEVTSRCIEMWVGISPYLWLKNSPFLSNEAP